MASLLLTRAVRRDRETALRLALGAGRARLLRQMLIEGIWFAIPGFVAAIGVAWAVQRLLVGFPAVFGVDLSVSLPLDRRLVLICGALSGATALLYVFTPALRLGAVQLSRFWKDDARTATPGGSGWLRPAVLVLQLALSMILLAGAMLVGRSLVQAQSLDPGYDLSRLIVMTLDTPETGAGADLEPAGMRALLAEVVRTPGVASVALASEVPLGGTRALVNVRSDADDVTPMTADRHFIDASFFSTLDIDLLRGRAFSDADAVGGEPIAIINQTLAARLWPGADSLGRTITVQADQTPPRVLRVIGVAPDVSYRGLWEQPRPYVYEHVPRRPDGARPPVLLVRTSDVPARIAPELQLLGQRTGISIASVSTGSDRLEHALAPQRAASLLVGAFAVVAVLVACVGLASTALLTVEQRRREIAIRVAVGGRSGRVTRQILRRFGWLVAIGVTVGGVSGAAFTPLLAGQAPGVPARDWTTFAAAGAALLVCCALAALVPALRAARVNPAKTLRA